MARYNAGQIPASPTVVSGVTAFGTHVNPFIEAVMSGNSGTAKPDSAAAGLIYSKTVTGGFEPTLVTGASAEVSLGEINTASGQYTLPIEAIEGALDSSGRGALPGTVIMHAATSAPTGYLKCNGAAVSRTTYAALFSAIGTTYGTGNGSTTFNLPDLRGEFVRGWDDGRGVDSARAMGSAQGEAFKSHFHESGFYAGTTDTTAISGSFTLRGRQSAEQVVTNASGVLSDLGRNAAFGDGLSISSDPGTFNFQRVSLSADHNHTFDVAGTSASEGGTETRPRNVALLFCIKF